MTESYEAIIDRVVYRDRALGPADPAGHWGFHDDHRQNDDGTGAYRPALQQVREEYMELLHVLHVNGCFAGRALQLGIGMTDHSHEIFKQIFKGGCVSIDIRTLIAATGSGYPGARTDAPAAIDFARERAPYSFVLVDAGHSLEDVEHDYEKYWPMLSPGGIMAFHDALDREGYPEIDVPGFVRSLEVDRSLEVHIIGTEVGFAWIRKQS